MAYFVYILECLDGTYYTGSTTDVERRLREHNEGNGGAYTRARRPVRLVHSEQHTDRSTAQKREAFIKKLTHTKKRDLTTEK